MPKKYKIAIITLSVLLAVSAVSLTATLIYNAGNPSEPAKVVVPNNMITPDPDNRTEAAGQAHYTSNGIDPAAGAASVNSPAADGTDNDDESYDAAALAADTDNAVVAAAEDGTSASTYADALYLHNKNADDNTPFAVNNMFPGDTETKYYCVHVKYKGDVIVRYHADIHEGYEKLAEVLKCRVVLLTTGEVLYDGLMRDMPASINHPLKTSVETESELYYRIDAYLETSVGNDYQLKDLVADFRWWVEETDNLIPPKTGDSSALPYLITASVSCFFLALLLKKKKKEDADNA